MFNKFISVIFLLVFGYLVLVANATETANSTHLQGESYMEKHEGFWDNTKEAAHETWKKAKDVGEDVWEGTKKVGGEVWDKTKDVGEHAWEATKETFDGEKKHHHHSKSCCKDKLN